jgi:hypothetical protein
VGFEQDAVAREGEGRHVSGLAVPVLCLDAKFLSGKVTTKTTDTSVAAKSANSNTEGKSPIKPTPENLADANHVEAYQDGLRAANNT